jgi:molybdate transport system substrate-binding protein
MRAAASISLLLLLLGLGLSLASPAEVAEIDVYAAASLTEALEEIAAAYEQSGGAKVVLNLGASSTLARQIQEGAPADLFFSADEAKMDLLERQGLVLAGTRRSLLSNTLVVVVPMDSNLEIGSVQDLAAPKVRALALAEPQSVPAGIYAKEYLRSQKLWSKIIDKVIPTENVRAALSAVESGNVDAGIVYKTDAAISRKVKIAYEVPAAEGPKISYPVAVLAGSKGQAGSRQNAARKFLIYLESPAALDVFRRYGFLVTAR